MVIYILFKFISVFDPEMRDFFDEPRHPAGFHALIFNINVFNNPHKVFRLRRTFSTLKAKNRGEHSSAEKDPFMDRKLELRQEPYVIFKKFANVIDSVF
jgi:hypothetical protein